MANLRPRKRSAETTPRQSLRRKCRKTVSYSEKALAIKNENEIDSSGINMKLSSVAIPQPSNANSNPFNFTGLPLEIRMMIYSMAFENNDIKLEYERSFHPEHTPAKWNLIQKKNSNALLRVSKMCYEEAIDIYLQSSRIIMSKEHEAVDPVTFTATLSTKLCEHIKKLEVHTAHAWCAVDGPKPLLFPNLQKLTIVNTADADWTTQRTREDIREPSTKLMIEFAKADLAEEILSRVCYSGFTEAKLRSSLAFLTSPDTEIWYKDYRFRWISYPSRFMSLDNVVQKWSRDYSYNPRTGEIIFGPIRRGASLYKR